MFKLIYLSVITYKLYNKKQSEEYSLNDYWNYIRFSILILFINYIGSLDVKSCRTCALNVINTVTNNTLNTDFCIESKDVLK